VGRHVVSGRLTERLRKRCAGQHGRFITLTYDRTDWPDGPESLYRASKRERHVGEFMRALARHAKVKTSGNWICKKEFQTGGWLHYHIILLGVSWIDARKLHAAWPRGRCEVQPLHERHCSYVSKVGKPYLAKSEQLPAFLYVGRPGACKIVSVARGFWDGPFGKRPPRAGEPGGPCSKQPTCGCDRCEEDRRYGGCYEAEEAEAAYEWQQDRKCRISPDVIHNHVGLNLRRHRTRTIAIREKAGSSAGEYAGTLNVPAHKALSAAVYAGIPHEVGENGWTYIDAEVDVVSEAIRQHQSYLDGLSRKCLDAAAAAGFAPGALADGVNPALAAEPYLYPIGQTVEPGGGWSRPAGPPGLWLTPESAADYIRRANCPASWRHLHPTTADYLLERMELEQSEAGWLS
jgi:hypothetical protein